MKQTLIFHARKYPLMEPTDAVKLIYQNEFGPGHLIANKDNAHRWLIKEVATATFSDLPYEDIGNGLIRVNITPSTDTERLLDIFCRSAEEVKGNVKSFEEKLDILRELTEQGVFSFSANALEDYLQEYAKAGYPAVSHSQVYRDNYRPSYRVVLRRYFDE